MGTIVLMYFDIFSMKTTHILNRKPMIYLYHILSKQYVGNELEEN